MAAFLSFGASLGWPFGYVFAGRTGALAGAIVGIAGVFVALMVRLEYFSDFP